MDGERGWAMQYLFHRFLSARFGLNEASDDRESGDKAVPILGPSISNNRLELVFL